MDKNILEALQAYGRDNFITNAGDYWSRSNAEFEAGKPGLFDRTIRAVNPMTALGSAMGSMQDGASKGDGKEMGLAMLQALPMFGALKATVPTLKSASTLVPSLSRTAARVGADTVGSLTIDELQALELQKQRNTVYAMRNRK